MDLIKKRYTFKNKEGEEVGYYRFFIRLNDVSFEVTAPTRQIERNGQDIKVKDPAVMTLLKAFAKDETPETEIQEEK